MKKIIIILFVITLTVLLSRGEEQILIPKDAIRYRIIANSNSNEDQNMKKELNEAISPIINDSLLSSNSIEDAREKIKGSMLEVEEILKNKNIEYKMNYGQNYFPKKTYQNIIYPEGEYESLVITLGNGLGDNWWCVLFPPLCLLEAKEDDLENVNYEFYVQKIIDKFY